jgi:hypothetical protein
MTFTKQIGIKNAGEYFESTLEYNRRLHNLE